MIKSTVLILLVLYGSLAANVPNTPPRFSSGFYQEVVIGFGGGTSGFTSGLTGGLTSLSGDLEDKEVEAKQVIKKMASNIGLPVNKVEEQLNLFRRDLNLDIKLSVKGTQQVDVTNNILQQNAKQVGFTFPMMQPITMDIDATILLYYDLNKNFTWDDFGGCTCTEIQGSSQMPLFSIPPFATLKQTGVQITVNGEQVTADVYDAEFNMGFYSPYSNGAKRSTSDTNDLFSMSFGLYVDGNKQVRRMTYGFDMMGMMSINTTIDMWDIKSLKDSDLILPDTSCKDKCKPVLPTGNVYPKCEVPSDQCACPNPIPAFCSQVDYPVSTLIPVETVDQMTQEVYNGLITVMQTVGEVSQDCQVGLKDFLCKFYFPVCNQTYNLLKPDLSVFTCGSSLKRGLHESTSDKQKDKAMESSAAFSAYQAADGKTQDHEKNDDKNKKHDGGLKGWEIAIIAVGCVLVVGGAVAAFFIIRRKRNSYQTIH